MQRPCKMKIFLILSLVILTIFFTVQKVFYSAKRNLYKDQAAWSGKDIKIKHNKSKELSELSKKDNFLNIIANESKFYLENQSKQEKNSD